MGEGERHFELHQTCTPGSTADVFTASRSCVIFDRHRFFVACFSTFTRALFGFRRSGKKHFANALAKATPGILLGDGSRSLSHFAKMPPVGKSPGQAIGECNRISRGKDPATFAVTDDIGATRCCRCI